MFASQRTAGSGNTATVALLAGAVVFIPGIALFIQPGHLGLSLAVAGSTICALAAWVNWKRSTRAPSAPVPAKAK